jgi:hypothetical protein
VKASGKDKWDETSDFLPTENSVSQSNVDRLYIWSNYPNI